MTRKSENSLPLRSDHVARPNAAAQLTKAWRPAYEVASRHRRVATTIIYAVVAALSYALAYLLRFDFAVPAEQRTILTGTLPLVVLLRLAASYTFSISTGRWRYVSTSDVQRLIASTLSASIALFLLGWAVDLLPAIPRSVLIIDFLLFTSFIAGTWILYRSVFEQFRMLSLRTGRATRVLIVGAGEAGSLLAREITRSGMRHLVGFVDDDPTKLYATIHGLPVLGDVTQIPTLADQHGIQEIVIAVPSATPAQLRRIVESCEATDIRFKVLPGLSDVLEGHVQWNQVRPLRIEDLLGREPIALELPELYGDLFGRTVLITGAAGSIGSELSRQVALHHPRTLVLLDQAETALFEVWHELRDDHPELDIHFVVGDIADEVAVNEVFKRFLPTRVFHAAAYKHVTMMQSHVRQAIRNNVVGTLHVAAAAGRHGAEKFVFVSTDKAVSPTSVMGASKRLAEIAVMQLQERYPTTTYAAVRFGNVLGSNGSVIPIFRKQISDGKPLTITHPDATRYFMMIPEAVQLILQASLLPEVRGHIAMLDMGEPVKIVDLARNLLRIAGLPHKNGHSIVFTGLRAGEKLHEELLAPGERTRATKIEKVRIVEPEQASSINVTQLLARWEIAFRADNESEVLRELVELFPGVCTELERSETLIREAM